MTTGLRDRTHLEIAMVAAVRAGIAPDEVTARRDMEKLLQQHTALLKTNYLRERNGGIRGWQMLLRTFGYEEKLGVKPLSSPVQDKNH